MAAFIAVIAEQAKVAMSEREEDILKAWHENIEEANANEKPFPPLKIAIAATVDIEKAAIQTAISFTAKYTTTVTSPLPDPNQPELPEL